MNTLEQKFLDYIEKNFLIFPGDRVICALSGGCDSVCLLLLLSRLPEAKKPAALTALHIHHGIRGGEADRDEAFCRALCASLEIPLTVRHEDIPALAKMRGESLEEAGRRRRLEIFGEEARGALSCVKVAAAHHRDDQAETLLMNLCRGSGPSGLAGMRPSREDARGFVLIRPLLFAARAELEAYVRAAGTGWCEDSTNASGENTRGRLRTEVLPELDRLFPGAARHLAAFAEKEAAQEDLLESLAEAALAAAERADGSLDAQRLQPLHPCLRQRVLSRWLLQNGGRKDIGEAHYAGLEGLLEGQSGRCLDLPCGRRVLREQDALRMIFPGTGREALPGRKDQSGGESRQERVPERFSDRFTVRIFPSPFAASGTGPEKSLWFPKKTYTKWLDYDTIIEPLSFRSRRPGDYISLPGGGRQSLQDFFVNEKIPLSKRDGIPLAASGSHVLWIVGYRISAAAGISEKTATIVEISYEGEYEEASSGSSDRQ